MLQGTLSLLVYLGWTLISVFLTYNFLRALRQRGMVFAVARLLSVRMLLPLLLVLSLTLIKLSLVFVYPQQMGVVVSLLHPAQGIRPEPLRAGLHWVWPMAEKVVLYPVYWQTYTMAGRAFETDKGVSDAIATRTLDSQQVDVDVSVIFRLDPERIIDLHILWQDRYKDDYLRPNIRSILRRLVSQYTVDQVNSEQRTELERALDQELKAMTLEHGLVVEQVLLRNLAFTPEYAASVERKQVALQGQKMKEYEALQIANLAKGKARRIEIIARAEAKAIKVKAEAEAKARLVRAEAEKQALNLVGEALKDRRNLLAYRYIERLSPNVKAVVLPNDIPLIFPLPELDAPMAAAQATTQVIPQAVPAPQIGQ